MATREPSAPKRATILSPDSQLARELEPLLSSHLEGIAPRKVDVYPSPNKVGTEFDSNEPQIVFLDVASDWEQAQPVLEVLVRMGGHIQVVALLGKDDPDLILRSLRIGAVDFLIRPFSADQVESAFGKLSRTATSSTQTFGGREPAKIFAVLPAKGACGATTLAYNLAYQWKRLGAKRILLAELDPATGHLSFLLKIKSIYSFMDALQRAHELDEDLWAAMVTKVNGVDVLLAPDMLSESGNEFTDPAPILEYARHAYDVVIIDAGSVYGDWNINIARTATEVFLVTTNELPALQATQRALSYLDSNRIGRWKIRLIVNRYLRDVGLSRDVIGTALHTEVFETLPADYEAIQRALLDGKPIASNTALGKAVSQLADKFGKPKAKEKKSAGLGGLLGLFSKSK